jgi:hypothetical protein
MPKNDLIEKVAQAIVKGMNPREIGLMLYPSARPIPLSEVPEEIVQEHLDRYTEEDLKTGQFLETSKGNYTFIMNHETKRRITSKKKGPQ